MKKLVGFEACVECHNTTGVIYSLCRSVSDTCPPIPDFIKDHEIKEYLAIEMGKLRKTGKSDMVNHPPHYNSHPSGIECIQVTEHMTFNVGNAVKYLWRVDEKDNPFQDLDKAIWYIQREIEKRKKSEEK
jgi:hypothetical protein